MISDHFPGRRSLLVALFSAACLLPLAASLPAAAGDNPTYANVIPHAAAVTLHARITGIYHETRQVTLTGRSGTPVTRVAGPMVRLEMLKVGDAVNATYYRSVAFVVSAAGTPIPEDEAKFAMARSAEAPGGVAVTVTRVSGLVVGIDLAAHSLDLVDPRGAGVYTIEVVDPARHAQMSSLKLGDTITVVVSQILAVSIDPAAKNLF